ncbi:DUF7768 domain-containing protein [Corynebacterium belfantii]|uniref:DUF7768 domain-containing protein n=1 Tax=Corynebacterium belfantii TaxID=2014537 RepID=UPI0018D318CA|nr:DUF4406 domain-containing protein [Corynebacterium belfantii]MBG9319427.1 DUF4406 domain-containing protein [Corynebacterium belfantii]
MSTTTDQVLGLSRRNSHGYADPTSYRVLKQLQQTESMSRPLTYMCSPYSGDVRANTALARQFCGFAISCGQIPLAPHLLFPQFMNDHDPDERELAMAFNRVLLSRCDAVWVYTGRVSKGMRAEIEWARQLELPTRYFNADFQEVTY